MGCRDELNGIELECFGRRRAVGSCGPPVCVVGGGWPIGSGGAVVGWDDRSTI